ncbi:MAG: response regulator [Candidatus Omnitrophica bacterium]|nr:response regulator [Candidatus Omnitrophota bacterium]
MSRQPLPPHAETVPGRRHVLLIEPDVTRRQMLYDVLTRRGLNVYTARTAEMVRTILEYDRPDLILLNPSLPDTTGSELIMKIRSFNPSVPILLLNDAPAALTLDASCAVQGRLPRELAAEPLIAEVTLWLNAPPSSCPLPQTGAILLVDDETRMRIIMQNLLELNGFTVTAAASGEEGLARLAQSKPDAVMLDVRMPGMDGLVVLKKIREQDAQLPVILVTQVDEEATREEAIRLGATAYVTKPFNFDGLKQVLHQAIPSTKSPASSASGSGSNG